MAVQYVHRNERKKTVPRYFFFLIGLKLSGRNCQTINCAFFIRVAQSEGGSVVGRLRCQPQSFPLLFTAFVYLIFQLTSTI